MSAATPHHGLDFHGVAKPKLRGLVHAWAIAPFALAGVVLTAIAPTERSRAAVAVYSLAITGMLTASASYHRLRVSATVSRWLRRLDHSMIGVAVAGTYTPVIVLTSGGALRSVLLVVLWSGAAGSALLALVWLGAPRWLRSGVYVLLGISGVAVTPSLWRHAGATPFWFIMAGAAFYIAGAVVYAVRRPNPSPSFFGFHEVFHTLVLLAVASHFTAIAFVVDRTA